MVVIKEGRGQVGGIGMEQDLQEGSEDRKTG